MSSSVQTMLVKIFEHVLLSGSSSVCGPVGASLWPAGPSTHRPVKSAATPIVAEIRLHRLRRIAPAAVAASCAHRGDRIDSSMLAKTPGSRAVGMVRSIQAEITLR